MRILIAEDDVTSRTMLAAVLKKDGHEVEAVVDGAEALTALQSSDAPRLAILDWMMPGMDGLEVVRQMRRLESAQPTYIIMLTAKTEKADIVAGLDAGADDYLAKPFDVGELRARVSVGRRIVELQDRLAQQVEELTEALEHIKTLQGIIPICCFCKKIRNDQGYWDQVDSYVARHSDAQFSHGVCPDCLEERYPANAEEKEEDEEESIAKA